MNVDSEQCNGITVSFSTVCMVKSSDNVTCSHITHLYIKPYKISSYITCYIVYINYHTSTMLLSSYHVIKHRLKVLCSIILLAGI